MQVLEMALHVLSMNGIRFTAEEFLGLFNFGRFVRTFFDVSLWAKASRSWLLSDSDG